MEEFIRNYGLWILLGVVFIAMHGFGMGCGGGHSHGSKPAEGSEQADAPARAGEEKKPVTTSRTTGRTGGCH